MEIDQSLGIKQHALFDRIVVFTTVGLFAAMIVLATSQVLIRNLNVPVSFPWTEPAARYILIVATYFGAAVASRNAQHVRMSYLLNKVEDRSPRTGRAFDLISTTVVVGFVTFAVWGTTRAAMNNWGSDIGGIGFLTSGMLYLGITLGLACMLVYELYSLSQQIDGDWLLDRVVR